MARSAKDRLRAIEEQERRVQEQAERVAAARENFLRPTISKITKIAEAAANNFVRENMSKIDDMNIDPKNLQDAIEKLLEEKVLKQRQAAPKPAMPQTPPMSA